MDPGVGSPRTEVLIIANPLPCDSVPAAGGRGPGAASTAPTPAGRHAALIMVAAGRRYKLCIPDAWPPEDPVARGYLYDLGNDHEEAINLIDSATHRPVVEALSAR